MEQQTARVHGGLWGAACAARAKRVFRVIVRRRMRGMRGTRARYIVSDVLADVTDNVIPRPPAWSSDRLVARLLESEILRKVRVLFSHYTYRVTVT